MYDTLEHLATDLEHQARHLVSHGVDNTADHATRLERLTTELAAAKRAENAAVAAQDTLIAQIAAIENVPCDDGTFVEVSHALGSARLDAAALISDALGVSDPVAGRRLRRALWLATEGHVVWDALAAGRIDDFRATIIHEELVDASPEGTELLLGRLKDRLGDETAGFLRRRVRRMLTGLEPDALTRRAEKARTARSLQRWIGEPGMDRWLADLPADQAGPAFHAIDTRAHERLHEGLSPSIDAARADAMLELILGHCVGTIGVQFAVPTTVLLQAAVSETEAASMDPSDLISVDGLSTTGPVHLRRTDLTDLLDTLLTALTEQAEPTKPPEQAQHAQQADTGRGATTSEQATGSPAEKRGNTRKAGKAGKAGTAAGQSVIAKLVGCDPTTGAALTIPLDPASTRARVTTPQLASTAHDPPAALKTLVQARDGHCRFPGCTTNIRVCDIDHVIAWPMGPTAAHNLICLCRRHHRIKQLPGWHATLLPDGKVIWTDPTGRQRTTHPIDHLHLDQTGAARTRLPHKAIRDIGLAAESAGRPAENAGQPGEPVRWTAAAAELVDPSGQWPDWSDHDQFSLLEHHLEHLIAEAEAITKTAATQAAEQANRDALHAARVARVARIARHNPASPANPDDDPPPSNTRPKPARQTRDWATDLRHTSGIAGTESIAGPEPARAPSAVPRHSSSAGLSSRSRCA